MPSAPRATMRPPPGFAPLPVHRVANRSQQADLKKKLLLDQASDTDSTEDEYEGEGMDDLSDLPCPQESDDRLRRLEQLLASVDELTAIEREIDLLNEKFGFIGQKRASDEVPEKNKGEVPAFAPPTVVPVSQLAAAAPKSENDDDSVPAGWYRKESGNYPGRFYFVNKKTGETSWKTPKAVVEAKVASTPATFAPPPGLEHMVASKDLGKKGGVSDAELSTDIGAMTCLESDYDSDWSCAPSYPARSLSAKAPAFLPAATKRAAGY